MARHSELASIPFNDGRHRFCLDRVIRDEEDGRIEFAFVWRGTITSPDGFVPKPAYFNFDLMGRTIKQAIDNGAITFNELAELLCSISGLRRP